MFFGKRRQLLVDHSVQGAIILRCLLYWVACLVTTFLILFFWTLITGPARVSWMTIDQIWFSYGPAFVASILLMPLIGYDLLKMSNRLAGPILRIRRQLKMLANGEHVTPLYFRKGDYWRDMADDFNRLVAHVQELESQLGTHDKLPAEDFSRQPELLLAQSGCGSRV